MSCYHKINTLFKRDPKTKKITSQYSLMCFDNITYYSVEEKVDGTNIRITIENDVLSIGGRTDAAQIPPHLLNYLNSKFTIDKVKEVLETDHIEYAIIYGEGIGPKIQEPMGSKYSDEPVFMMFDIRIGRFWLERDSYERIAEKLSVPCVPFLGIMTKEEIIDVVKHKPMSICSKQTQMMEGLVCKTPYFDRNGQRILFKLKCTDYD